MGVSRKIYNTTVDYYNRDDKDSINWMKVTHVIFNELSEYEWLSKDYGDCRLTRENGRWFLIVPTREMVETIHFENQEGAVALDPGVRTFMAYFSSDGRFGLIGYRACDEIFKKLNKMDTLLSQRDLCKKDRRKRAVFDRKIRKLRWKVQDMVDELHWKTINYLVKNYKVIYLPTYETSEMTKRGKRKINHNVVRNMLSFRDFEFAERLKNKCEEYGVTLVRCNEAYTSKTNSFSGEIMNIGSREWFTYDGVRINRDVNGARNILLRAMRDDSAIG